MGLLKTVRKVFKIIASEIGTFFMSWGANVLQLALNLSIMLSSLKVVVKFKLPVPNSWIPELDIHKFPMPDFFKSLVAMMEVLATLDLMNIKFFGFNFNFNLDVPNFKLPSFEEMNLGLTLCPLFAPSSLVLVLFGACVILFVLLELKAIFSLTYLIPITVNNMPHSWIKTVCQKVMTQDRVLKVLITVITLTLSAVSSSVYSATESVACEELGSEFFVLTTYIYAPSISMLMVLGFALFAGRLDNISQLLLGDIDPEKSNFRLAMDRLLIPFHFFKELCISLVSLVLLIPGFWRKFQVDNFGVIDSLHESADIVAMQKVAGGHDIEVPKLMRHEPLEDRTLLFLELNAKLRTAFFMLFPAGAIVAKTAEA